VVSCAHIYSSAVWSSTLGTAPVGNVLGAINAITHEMVTVTNDAYITAQSVCELLEKIAALYVGIPITIFLDNARYQKCALVMEKAKSLNLELCFLPTYSPNLNLIERAWKFVKKKRLYSKYYEKFPAFKEAISKCLDETMTLINPISILCSPCVFNSLKKRSL
jgi:transposase